MIQRYLLVFVFFPFLLFGMEPSSKRTLEILLSLKGPFKLSEITDGKALLISEEGKEELKMKLEERKGRHGGNQFCLPLYTWSNEKPAYTLYFYKAFEFDKNGGRLKVNVRSLNNKRKLTALNFYKKNETPALEIYLDEHGIITSLYFKAFRFTSSSSSESKSEDDEDNVEIDPKLAKRWLWAIWDEIGGT